MSHLNSPQQMGHPRMHNVSLDAATISSILQNSQPDPAYEGMDNYLMSWIRLSGTGNTLGQWVPRTTFENHCSRGCVHTRSLIA